MRRKENKKKRINTTILRAFLKFLMVGLVVSAVQAQESMKSTSRQIHCMGESWKVKVYSTSEEGIVLLRGDDPALFGIARALGRDLRWSPEQTSLINLDGKALHVGQKSIAVNGKDTELKVSPQIVGGAVHVPSNGLEGLLDCKVTVKSGQQGAIYVEPILQGINFTEKDSKSTEMSVRTSVPVRKKMFTLNNPKRTVVDLVGVAIPEGEFDVEHPALGKVRVGQFQLAPSTTRIVLPTASGVKVNTYRSLDLYEHQLTVTWPRGQKPGSGGGERVATVQIPKVDPAVREPVIRIGPNDSRTASRPKPTPPAPKPAPPAPTSSTEDPDSRTTDTTIKSDRILLQSATWEGNKIKLQFSQPVPYKWSRVNTGKERFVLDFPGVVFPQKKMNLDSSVPGLESVRIVQNMPEPQPIVRLVCDLETSLAVDTQSKNETVLYLSFPGRRIGSGDLLSGMGHTSDQVPVTAGTGSAQGRTVCIDPGHGGSDPGALNRAVGINESHVTLDIALKLAKILKSQGWNVVLTRTSDRDVSWAGSSASQELGARTKIANDVGADLFISIHADASANTEVQGTSIHWYKGGDYRLAQHLESGVLDATGRRNRGLVKNRFYVLAHTQMPAVLIETAFLSNPTEGKLLADPAYRERIAQGIASGLGVYAAKNFPGTASRK